MDPRRLVVVLGVATGLPTLRALFPLMVYGLRDRLGVSTPVLGGLALVLFGLAFLAPPLARRFGPPRTAAVALLALAILRGLVPALRAEPLLSLAAAAAGSLAFLFLLAAADRSRPGDALLGALLDVSIHALAGTRDLHWGGGAAEWGSGLLAATGLVVAWRALRHETWAAATAPRPAPVSAIAAFAWGPWLFLHLELLGNVARHDARTGLSPGPSGALVAAGLAVGVVVAAWSRRGPLATGRGAAVLAAVLALGTLPRLDVAPPLPFVLLFVGQVSAAALFARARDADSAPGEHATPMFGTGILVFVGLVFLHYAGYDLRLPIRSGPLLVLGTLALVAAGLAPATAGIVRRLPRRAPRPALAAVVIALAVVPLARRTPPALAPPPAVDPATLRIVTFNLHAGFDERGGFALDRMLDALDQVGPDVVALQEVSRGWLVNGSCDVYELARARLRMAGVPGPTAGLDWGNAVLARRTPIRFENRPLPPSRLPLPRAVLKTGVPSAAPGEPPLRVYATHLHHVAADHEVRDQQARFLATTLDIGAAAVLLGDFNATAASECLTILRGAGWRDVVDPRAPPEDVATYPARDPVRRIDTILLGGRVRLERAFVARPWGSDHRAVVADVTIEADPSARAAGIPAPSAAAAGSGGLAHE